MSKKHKHRSIIEKAKEQARSIRNEAYIQATQAASTGGIRGIYQPFKNYIDGIKRAVEESKRSKKKKQSKKKGYG
jgi:hypothetical protein